MLYFIQICQMSVLVTRVTLMDSVLTRSTHLSATVMKVGQVNTASKVGYIWLE